MIHQIPEVRHVGGESPQHRFIPVDETRAQQIIEIPPEIVESMNAFRNVDLSLRNNNVMIWDALCARTFVIIAAVAFFSLNYWPYSHSSTYRRTTTLPESGDRNLFIWNSSTGHCKTTLVGHDGPVTAIAVFPEGRIVYGSRDNTVRIWNSSIGECERILLSASKLIGSPLSPYCLIAVLCPAQMAVYVFRTHTPVISVKEHSPPAKVFGSPLLLCSQMVDLYLVRVTKSCAFGHSPDTAKRYSLNQNPL